MSMSGAATGASLVTRLGIEGLGAYTTGMKGAGDEVEKLAKRSNKSLGDIGRNLDAHGKKMTTRMTVPIVAAGAAAFVAFSNYDQTIRQFGANADLGGKKLAGFSTLALKMGKETSFSAKQAADAMLELSKGGMTAVQIKGGALKQTLTLAAAGSLELGQAAGYMTNTLNMFGMSADKASVVAAALAGGANASTASVQSLGMGLSQVGAGAKDAGMGLNETVAALSALDQGGVKGSDAGTSLKQMLASLAPTAKIQKNAIKSLGLEFTNTNGTFKTMAQVAQELKTKLGPLGEVQRKQALNTIFGSDASRAASIIMSNGAVGITKYTRATMDMSAAQKMAATNTQGAKGSIEQMMGSIETAGIAIGKDIAPAVIDLSNHVMHLANAFTSLPQPIQESIIAAAGLTAVLGPMLSMTGKAMVGIAGIRSAFAGAEIAAAGAGVGVEAAAGGMGLMALATNPITLGLGAAAAAAIGITLAVRHAHAEDEKWRKTGIELSDIIVKRQAASKELAAAHRATAKATAELKKADDDAGKNSPAYIAASAARKTAIDNEATAKKKLNDLEGAAKAKVGGVGDGKGAARGKADAGESAGARAALVGTEEKIADAKERQAKANAKLAEQSAPSTRHYDKDTMSMQGQTTLQGNIDAARKAQKALNEEMKHAKDADLPKLSKQYNDNAAEIKRNQDELNKLGDKAEDAGKKLSGLQTDAKRAAAGLSDMSPKELDRLVKSLDAGGQSARAVAMDLSHMAATPLNLKIAKKMLTEMDATTRAATFGTSDVNAILKMIGTGSISPDIEESFSASIARMRANSTVTIKINAQKNKDITSYGTTGLPGGRDGNPATPFAKGGMVPGRGPNKDSVLAMLTPGEYVVPRDVVDRVGAKSFDHMLSFYNTGGLVQKEKTTDKKKPKKTKPAKSSTEQDYIDAATKEADRTVAGLEVKKKAQEKLLSDLQKKEVAAKKAVAVAQDVYNARKAKYNGMKAGTKAQKDAKEKYRTGTLADAVQSLENKKGAVADITGKRKEAGSNVVSLRTELQNAKITAASKEFLKTESKLKTDLAAANLIDEDGDGDFTNDAGDKAIEKNLRNNASAKAKALQDLLKASPGLSEDQVQGIESDIQSALADSAEPAADTQSEDQKATIEAQLAQSQRQAQIAQDTATLNANALKTFAGANDLGYAGGANAFQAAQGAQPTVINNTINSLSGNDPAIQSALARTSNTGNSNGSNADIMYDGRRAAGL